MTTRDEFVEKVVELILSAVPTSGPVKHGRDIGEALVGMGVSLLEQLGVAREDIARSILDIRNRS